MSTVYFKPIDDYGRTAEINDSAGLLLDILVNTDFRGTISYKHFKPITNH